MAAVVIKTKKAIRIKKYRGNKKLNINRVKIIGNITIEIRKIITSPAKKFIKNNKIAISKLTNQFFINILYPSSKDLINELFSIDTAIIAYFIIKAIDTATGKNTVKKMV